MFGESYHFKTIISMLGYRSTSCMFMLYLIQRRILSPSLGSTMRWYLILISLRKVLWISIDNCGVGIVLITWMCYLGHVCIGLTLLPLCIRFNTSQRLILWITLLILGSSWVMVFLVLVHIICTLVLTQRCR